MTRDTEPKSIRLDVTWLKSEVHKKWRIKINFFLTWRESIRVNIDLCNDVGAWKIKFKDSSKNYF